MEKCSKTYSKAPRAPKHDARDALLFLFYFVSAKSTKSPIRPANVHRPSFCS